MNTQIKRNATGAFSIAMPATLTAGQTYHYRMNVMNGGTVVNGGDQSFTLTLPTMTTAAASSVSYDTTTHATFNLISTLIRTLW
jgi:hypothetical protein